MAIQGILRVKDILDEYSVDVQEMIESESKQIAKKGATKLKSSSPKLTGDYAKGWRVKTERGKGWIRNIIHNETNYQLTHLLEKPHLLRNGKLSTPQVHIAPVEQECSREYEKRVEQEIKNGV